MWRLAKKLEERMSAPMRSLLNLAAFSHGFLDFFIRICKPGCRLPGLLNPTGAHFWSVDINPRVMGGMEVRPPERSPSVRKP
jgi:hypothetical protein